MTQVYVIFKKDFEDITNNHGILLTIFRNKQDAEQYVSKFNDNADNSEQAFFKVIDVQ